MVRPHIQPYIVASNIISESFHADKWVKETKPELLTPMWAQKNTGKHYYIFELAGLRNGSLVIPLKWVIRNGEMTADAIRVSRNANVSKFCIFIITS